MPVLVEGATLLGPEATLGPAVLAEGGARALGADGLSADGALLALRFGPGGDIAGAARRLEARGVRLGLREEPGDLAAVGQRQGPAGWWPWLELAHLPAPEGAPGVVLAARLAGAADRPLAAPAGWTFAGSLSERLGAAPLPLADRPLRHLRREPAGDVYLDRWTGEEVTLWRQHAPATVVVEAPDGGGGQVLAEVVSRGEEITVGLMFREALAPGTGMLFRFPGAWPHGFWMKNTLVPLDLLFADAGGWVVNVAEGAEPLTARLRRSAGPVQSVLEVPAGWCAAHRVGAGAALRVIAPPVR